MLVRCNCKRVGQLDLAVGIDFVGVDFGQAELGAGEFFVLRLRLRQQLFCEVQFVYFKDEKLQLPFTISISLIQGTYS